MSDADAARRAHWDRLLETTALEATARALGQDPDADLIGRRIGPYVVEAWLGSGGMGDVYRARDSRLARDVALKVLPDALAFDPAARERFAQEAQSLAALDHPHIAGIHGFEEAGPLCAIVLELADGPTLATRLAEGPMPVAEILSIARQIADALEAAHERGIVHRDLKPANVGVSPDGVVKVLDFGLATALRADPAPAAGPTLGTPAYMSPEHAQGRPAHRRDDIWAFGVLLFEMLAGCPPFVAQRSGEVLAAVRQQAIDWGALPPATPSPARRLLERCLDRDVRRRLRDIGEARIALDALVLEPLALTHDRDASPTAPPRHRWQARAGLLATAAVAGALVWALADRPSPSRPVTRFTYTLARDQPLLAPTSHHVLALSPDGTRLAYVGNRRLYVRALSELDARPVTGADAQGVILEPAFSPDGQAIAFWSGVDATIKTIALAGGTPLTICRAEVPSGLAWTREGLFYAVQGAGILRVPATGGAPSVVARVGEGEQAHGPQLVPGGGLLFTIAAGTALDRWDTARVVVQSLATGARKTVLERATDARYVPTGHLVYASPDGVHAVPFDARHQAVAGPIAATLPGVRRSSGRRTGAAQFAVSDSGSIVYVPGAVRRAGGAYAEARADARIVVADRAGRVDRVPLPPGPYRDVRVSPDGRRLAIAVEQGRDEAVYVYDRSGAGPPQRLTLGGRSRAPVWSADGRHLAFQSDRDDRSSIYWQLADGSRPAERLTTARPGEAHEPESWMPNDEGFLYSVSTRDGTTLWTLTLHDRRAAPFGDVRSTIPPEATFSPDGKWVAYVTAEPGPLSTAIIVQPYPATGARHPLVVDQPADAPLNSPHKPLWAPDGRALFYVPRLGGLEMVGVSTVPRFGFGRATPIPRPFQPAPPDARRNHDIGPDGRFVGLVSTEPTMPAEFDRTTIQVVLDWLSARPSN